MSASFDEIYSTEKSGILQIAFLKLRDWQAAEDITQVAFLKLWTKMQEEEVLHPPAYLRSWVYFLALERYKQAPGSMIPVESGTLAHLFQYCSDQGNLPDPLEMLEGLPDGDAAWESLVYWSRRFLETATAGTPEKQQKRLRALLEADCRQDALQFLAENGEPWKPSSVSMTLSRYSEKIDAELRRLLDAGPADDEERRHWNLFDGLCRLCPALTADGDQHQSTLSWFVRSVNAMPEDERLDFVSELFETRPDEEERPP